MKRIPTAGILGVVALREAATTEYGQIQGLVRAALDAVINAACPPDSRRWFDIEALFPDRVILYLDGRYWAYPYTIADDNQVQIGQKIEVIERYEPVTTPLREAVKPESVPEGHFIEAAEGDKTGLVWEAVLIRAGMNSASDTFYTDALLREAAPLFEGRPVFAKGDKEHLKGEGKSVHNIIGYLSDTHFVAGSGTDAGYVGGTVTFLEAASTFPATIREAWDRGKKDLVGLSVDADGRAKKQRMDGHMVRVPTKITKVRSVDLIVEPGAGGGLVRLIEAAADLHSQENSDMSLKQLLHAKIKAISPTKAAAINPDTASDDEIETAYREALNEEAGSGNLDQVDERIRMIEARSTARAKIAGCNLPQTAKDKLQAIFDKRERFTEADVDAQVKEEREYLARITESGRVRMGGLEIEFTEQRHEKIGDMLDAFFDRNHKNHRQVQSFRECYREVTGDHKVTGRLSDCDPVRLREALGDEAHFRESLDSSSFASVLGNSITRRLVADYRDMGQYDVWRNLADVVPVNDFRTNERTRYGGYGDLPTVGEGDPYGNLGSPTDEKATYGIGKKGGVEDITVEMIRNDDVGVIRRIPTKLSRSAKRTLAKFVLDFIRNNPTAYDGIALFHASHGNLGSAALDATSLAAGRLAMLKQTELNSADRIGIGPKHLWVPADLEEAANNLFNRNTNLDKTFIQTLSLTVNPVWYWTDTNDWAVTADKMDIPTIEVGFLDGNEEPEIFIQDTPNVGSLFSHDKITYKIRHIYGGNALEFRGMYKAVV